MKHLGWESIMTSFVYNILLSINSVLIGYNCHSSISLDFCIRADHKKLSDLFLKKTFLGLLPLRNITTIFFLGSERELEETNTCTLLVHHFII